MDLEQCVFGHTGSHIEAESETIFDNRREYALSNGSDLVVYDNDWNAEIKQRLFMKTGNLLARSFICGDKMCAVVRKTVSLEQRFHVFLVWLAPTPVQLDLIALFVKLANNRIFHRDCRVDNLAVAGNGQFIMIDSEHAEFLDSRCDQRDKDTCAARMMLNACYERIEYFDVWDKQKITRCPLWSRACELLFPGNESAISSWLDPFRVNQDQANQALRDRCLASQPLTWEILVECHVLIAQLLPSAHDWVIMPKADYIWPDMVIRIRGQEKFPRNPPMMVASSHPEKAESQPAWIAIDKNSPGTIETCIQAALAQRQGDLLGKGSRGSVFELRGEDNNTDRVIKVVAIKDQRGLLAWKAEAKKGTEIGLLGLGPLVHRYETCPNASAGFIVMDRVRPLNAAGFDAWSHMPDRPNLLEMRSHNKYGNVVDLFKRLAGQGIIDQGGWDSLGVTGDKMFVLRRVDGTRTFDNTTMRDRDFAVAAMILIRFKTDTRELRERAISTLMFRQALALVLGVDNKDVIKWKHSQVRSKIRNLFAPKEQITTRARSMSALNQEIVILCLQRLRVMIS